MTDEKTAKKEAPATPKPVKPKVLTMTDVVKTICIEQGGRETFELCVVACLKLAADKGLKQTAKGVEVSEANMKRQIKTVEADMENEVQGWRGKYQLVETKNGKPWYCFKLRPNAKQ